MSAAVVEEGAIPEISLIVKRRPACVLLGYTAFHGLATTTFPEGDCQMFAPTIFENRV